MAEVRLTTVLGLTPEERQVGYDLRAVADEMREAGHPYGMGPT